MSMPTAEELGYKPSTYKIRPTTDGQFRVSRVDSTILPRWFERESPFKTIDAATAAIDEYELSVARQYMKSWIAKQNTVEYTPDISIKNLYREARDASSQG